MNTTLVYVKSVKEVPPQREPKVSISAGAFVIITAGTYAFN